MRATRTPPLVRKTRILEWAIQLSKDIGYKNVTRDRVAEIASVSSALVGNYFPRMSDLKGAIMKTAIDKEILEIVAPAWAADDMLTRKISKDLKKKVIDYLSLK